MCSPKFTRVQCPHSTLDGLLLSSLSHLSHRTATNNASSTALTSGLTVATVGLATAYSMLLRSSIASCQPSTSCVAGGPTPLRYDVLYRRRVSARTSLVQAWQAHCPALLIMQAIADVAAPLEATNAFKLKASSHLSDLASFIRPTV